MDSIDVLGLGCAAVDDVLYVAGFPAADGKARVQRSIRRSGGLTFAALVAAGRAGARCAYAGCLGNDGLSEHIARELAQEGIDLRHAPRLPEARVVHSVIVVGEQNASRTIFFEANGVIGAHDSLPAKEVIAGAKVLLIDQYGMKGNLRAASIARSAAVPVVADFEDADVPLFEETLQLVDHLILSEDFALPLTGARTPAEAAVKLWRPNRAAVIITCGAKGCWSVSAEKPDGACHHAAFSVKPVDTTGCGDVFHGVYASRLACGEPLEKRIRLASAAAALRALKTETPNLAAIEEFLAGRVRLIS